MNRKSGLIGQDLPIPSDPVYPNSTVLYFASLLFTFIKFSQWKSIAVTELTLRGYVCSHIIYLAWNFTEHLIFRKKKMTLFICCLRRVQLCKCSIVIKCSLYQPVKKCEYISFHRLIKLLLYLSDRNQKEGYIMAKCVFIKYIIILFY